MCRLQRQSFLLSSLFAALTSNAIAARAQYVPNATFAGVARDTMLSSQRASWEQGTAAQAILEYDSPSWSIFAAPSLLYTGPPPITVLRFGYRAAVAQDSIGRLGVRVTGDENITIGSSADSASNGVATLLGGMGIWNGIGDDDRTWLLNASKMEVDFLINRTPRSKDGLISHRVQGVQAWSDSVYMAPPFLAFYGLYSNNQTLVWEGYNQCALYRKYLRSGGSNGKNLWFHILDIDQKKFIDQNLWLTGNGWAAAGMLRVLATIGQSPFSRTPLFVGASNDLQNWTLEILNAVFPRLPPANSSLPPLFNNYINRTSFQDAAGSMLLAYSAFRLADLSPSSAASKWIAGAERIYQAVQGQLDALGNFIGLDVVGVLSFRDKGKQSVESLAFALLLEGARRDYYSNLGLNATTGKTTLSLGKLNGTAVGLPPPSSSKSNTTTTTTSTSSSASAVTSTSMSATLSTSSSSLPSSVDSSGAPTSATVSSTATSATPSTNSTSGQIQRRHTRVRNSV